MEVTQGVQSLNNDVPLVADKPTYVRLYGRKLSGPSTYSVGALLYGTTAAGVPLPGSPLRPLNGGQDFVANNADPNRLSPQGGWLFQLPAEWAGNATIRLRPLVDPDRCDDIGAITHYVGLVHAGTNTKGNLGYGSTPGSNLYIKLIDQATLDTTPQFWQAQMTLSWRAADPDAGDRLLFNVQYSPVGGQRWQTMLTGLPDTTAGDMVSLDLRSLSGLSGSAAGGLIRVAASDGYNTTIATSRPFSVAERAPEPRIDSPGEAPIAAGKPVSLLGGAVDVKDGGLSGEALRWTLDGQAIGSGAQQTIAGLAPGSYSLALTASNAAGKTATVSSTLTIAPLVIPQRAAPALDGTCDDAAYADAPQVPLAPYSDGAQAFVRLVGGRRRAVRLLRGDAAHRRQLAGHAGGHPRGQRPQPRRAAAAGRLCVHHRRGRCDHQLRRQRRRLLHAGAGRRQRPDQRQRHNLDGGAADRRGRARRLGPGGGARRRAGLGERGGR
jgi:hypothetical protein